MEIKKVIVPAAGLGTRFLPASKVVPKEMMPLLNKPIIQYTLEEAVRSGIEDIFWVVNSKKKAIEEHFNYVSEEF